MRLRALHEHIEKLPCANPQCSNGAEDLREFISWNRVPGFSFIRWCPTCWEVFEKTKVNPCSRHTRL